MHKGSISEHDLVIEVIGVVLGRDAVVAVMSGWEEAMPQPDSLKWVRERVRERRRRDGRCARCAVGRSASRLAHASRGVPFRDRVE